MLGFHLIDMTSRRAEHEQARANDSRKTKIEASERGKEADSGETEACRRHLELEWAVGPADEGRRHPPKKPCIMKLQRWPTPIAQKMCQASSFSMTTDGPLGLFARVIATAENSRPMTMNVNE